MSQALQEMSSVIIEVDNGMDKYEKRICNGVKQKKLRTQNKWKNVCVENDCWAFEKDMTSHKCCKHGGGKKCSEEGCNSIVVSKNKCYKHGGRSTCIWTGCNKVSQTGEKMQNMCVRHAKINASGEGWL
jgi:hypothetical protein